MSQHTEQSSERSASEPPDFVQGSPTRYDYIRHSASPTLEDEEPQEGTSASFYKRNPTGKNQYSHCPPPDDTTVQEVLAKYHRQGVTNRNVLSDLLKTVHGIEISPTTVARRLKKLGLRASGATTRSLSESTKRQLILDQLDQDPTSRKSASTIKDEIRERTGVHLTREYIKDEMRFLDPVGPVLRQPSVKKKKKRTQLDVLGPHHEWSGHGHDKLSDIGFHIWGIRDVWSGVWLGLWVLPNNRIKIAIEYLCLRLIHTLGGMPFQMGTYCDSETECSFEVGGALREAFSPELEVLPVHRFLQSVNDTTVEGGWLRLRLQWGDNIEAAWEEGQGIYHSTDTKHYMLVQWLWPKLIQGELDQLRGRVNNHIVRKRKDRKKFHPSGISPTVALALHEKYGAMNCMQPVPQDVVAEIMEELGGEDLLCSVEKDYAIQAQRVYDALGISSISSDNVWYIFQAMLPYM